MLWATQIEFHEDCGKSRRKKPFRATQSSGKASVTRVSAVRLLTWQPKFQYPDASEWGEMTERDFAAASGHAARRSAERHVAKSLMCSFEVDATVVRVISRGGTTNGRCS